MHRNISLAVGKLTNNWLTWGCGRPDTQRIRAKALGCKWEKKGKMDQSVIERLILKELSKSQRVTNRLGDEAVSEVKFPASAWVEFHMFGHAWHLPKKELIPGAGAYKLGQIIVLQVFKTRFNSSSLEGWKSVVRGWVAMVRKLVRTLRLTWILI